MQRWVMFGAGLLAVTMFFSALASARSADETNTWAGVWDSSFGPLTLSASGSGSYKGYSPGTVTGTVKGSVVKGTWLQPGDPPKTGPFEFTLSPDGLHFTGIWSYKGDGCGSACGWDGTCVSGACLKNDAGNAPPLTIKGPSRPATSSLLVILDSRKGFEPPEATLRNGGTIKFCNRLSSEEILFSQSDHKEILFHAPQYDIRLAPPHCFSHVLRNPTKKPILLRIRANTFNSRQVKEPGLDLTVLP